MQSGGTGSKVNNAAHLFELRLGVDVHVADLAVEGFVLQACRRIGGGGQLRLDSAPREGLDGSVAAAHLQHRLVFSACRCKKKKTSPNIKYQRLSGAVGGETATFDLTAVVSLQLGGGVHRHLTKGAVEEAHGLLLLGLPFWRCPLLG